MSAEPIKAIFQDPRLDVIRKVVGTFDDQIPFLLLPVRLETRFVETDRSAGEASRPEVDAPALLGGVTVLRDQLQNLDSQNYTTAAKPEKKQLYAKLDAALAKIDASVTYLETGGKDAVACSPDQLTQLKTMLAQIQKLADGLPAKISGMKSNYLRKQYLDKFTACRQNRLDRLSTLFEAVTLPKLDFLATLQKADAGQIISRWRKNPQIVKPLLAGQNAQEQLLQDKAFLALLQEAETASKALIVGTSAEINSLHNGWGNFAADAGKWDDLLNSTAPVSRQLPASAVAAWKTLGKRWARVRGTILNPPRVFSNRDLTHSVRAFQQITQTLQQAAALFKGLAVSYDLASWQAGVSGLTTMTLAVQAMLNRPVILPKAYKEKLLGALAPLDASVLKAQAPSAALGAALEQAGGLLAGLIRSIESDYEAKDGLRFIVKTVTVDELWVRIFPDDIAVHTHEPELTPDEIAAGKNYWLEHWAAGGDPTLELGAWRQLCVTAGAQRAAWIASQMTPKPRSISGLGISDPALMRDAAKSIQTLDEALAGVQAWSLEKNGEQLSNQLDAILAQILKLNAGGKTLAQQVKNRWTKANLRLESLLRAPRAHQNQVAISRIAGNLKTKIWQIQDKVQALQELDVRDFSLHKIPLVFPVPATKNAAWTQPPKAVVMPDQFVILTMQGGQFIHIVAGSNIKDPLILGLNPQTFDINDSSYTLDREGNLQVHPEIRWLTEFGDAVACGMGVIIPLTPEQKAKGFDQVLALGVKNCTAQDAQNKLEELLENHHYKPRGMAFIPPGTPTNNTEQGKAGFASKLEPELTFAVERQEGLFKANETDIHRIADGKRLADSLGITPDIFQHIHNSGGQEVSRGLTVNRVLSPATLGYFMEEILNVFLSSTRSLTLEHFKQYVLGQGWLPSLRVGNQPYGILVTTAFSRFRYENETMPVITEADYENPSLLADKQKVRFDLLLRNLLNVIKEEWKQLLPAVKCDSNTDPANPQAHFMTMLGLDAHSVANLLRYGVNCAARQPQPVGDEPFVNFNSDAYYSIENVLATIRGTLYPTEEEWKALQERLSASRLYKIRYLQSQGELKGPKVAAALSERDSLAAGNYIQWLLEHDLVSIKRLSQLPSNSLLFLLLRHAWLLVYRDAALNILAAERLLDEDVRGKAASPKGYFIYSPSLNKFTTITLWNYLFDSLKSLDGLYQHTFDPNSNFYRKMNASTMANYCEQSLAYQVNVPTAHLDCLKPVQRMRADYQALLEIPTAQLDRLVTEHLDVCSYRLDAWLLSLANRRLSEQRAKNPQGIHLGAFGWVENLRPADEKPFAANLPPVLLDFKAEPVYQDTANEGFVHAPSLNHAAAAALLRSGYIANRGNQDLKNPLAVNLTSERVRIALRMLDGVRRGVDVGTLLGYQFERGLHERYRENLELDQYIYPLRRQFPGAPAVDDGLATGQEEREQVINEQQVMDGLALLKTVRDYLDQRGVLNSAGTLFDVFQANPQLYPFGLTGLPAEQNDTNIKGIQAIYKEIDRIADAFDALGDLMLAESVYQVAQGNHSRASLTVGALAEGKNPPEPEIVNTPRSGAVVTQRLLLNLKSIDGKSLLPSSGLPPDTVARNCQAAKPPCWRADLTPRALAEPALNYWLGERIGDPEQIRCWVKYEGANTAGTLAVFLSDLQLQPLDVIMIMGVVSSESASELNRRIAYYVRKALPQLDLETKLTISIQDRSEKLLKIPGEVLTSEIKTFYEIAPLIRALADLVLSSRPATAEDMSLPGDGNDPDTKRQDVEELQARLAQLKDTLENTARIWLKLWSDLFLGGQGNQNLELTGIKPENYKFADMDITNNLDALKNQANALRDFLWTAAFLGVPYAVPESVKENNDASVTALVQAGNTAFKLLIDRLKEAEPLLLKATVSAGMDAGKALLGGNFVMIPRYKLRNSADLAGMLAQKERWLQQAAGRNGLFPMDTWLQGVAKTRKRVAGAEMVKVLSDLFGQPTMEFIPGQLPFSKEDHWVGAAYPDSWQPQRNTLSLVMINSPADPAESQSGLLLDEWSEIIPNKEEMTGITFNYNQPNATAPQTLLLAVTPEETGHWQWDHLVYTLLDTLELAKLRGVEPDQVDKSTFSQFLPAVLGEVAPKDMANELAHPVGMQVISAFETNNQ